MGSPTVETVLKFINKNFITLQGDDKKYYNGHYLKVLDEFVNQMKFNDDLFNEIFEKLFFAGSYYDGLKISKPEEYDVDVVMKLPVNYDTLEIKCKKVSAGFVKVRATEIDNASSDSSNINVYKEMYSWTDNDGFLLQDQFRIWMFSVVDKTIASLTTNNSTTAELRIDDEIYQIRRRSNGPASTLNITMPNGAKLDVDLVPVIELKYPLHWPSQVRRNPFPDKESWFIVPKDNSKDIREFRNTYWRLAFHQQEKQMIKDKGLLKPVCRLIKKLRDTAGLSKVVSYYIKTIFLWAVDEEDESYWTNTGLGQLFMDMLKKLSYCFANRTISYYWDNRNNLLTGSGMTDAEMISIHTYLENVVVCINKKMSNDPNVFAKYLLTDGEFLRFKIEFLKMEVPGTSVGSINDDRSEAVAMAIEIRALKMESTRQKNEKKALENQMEAIQQAFENQMEGIQQAFENQIEVVLQAVNLLLIKNEDVQDRLDRNQSGMGYLFSTLKRNPYF